MTRLSSSLGILVGLLVATLVGSSACSSSPDTVQNACPAGQQTCNGVCKALSSDPQNCGACGNACGAGLFCSLSACSATCAQGLTACGAACENLASSPTHCGACNNPCASGVCNGGVCSVGGGSGGSGAVGMSGSGAGGGAGVAGSVSTGGGGSGTGGGSAGSGGGTGDGLFGGYHTSGDWSGFAFAFASGTATVAPMNFEDLVGVDGPYCIKGTVPGTADYSAIAAVGVHVNQKQAENAVVEVLAPQGDGLSVDITVKSGEKTIRVQLEDATPATDPMAAEHRWCTNLTADASGKIQTVVPWTSFNTQCWDAESGTAYAKQPLARAIAYVPDGGTGVNAQYDFCLNDIGPDSVMGRGTGSVVASCGNSVTWSAASLSGTQDAQSSGNAYRAQANFWNPVNGSFTMSLLPGAGFKLDTQSCKTTTDSPCSFPSIYVGVDGSGDRSTGSLPKVASTITSIPTCMGWSSGGTPKTDEYNVSFDVWFSSNAQASEAEEFLMIWYRDPPSFQPAGMFPVANGVVVGGQTWTLWHGPNHQGRPTTSFVAPNGIADGMAYQFDLMDFINEAAARSYITKSKNLIAIMGGLEVWGGGQGASITGFKTAVQ
jgi:Glycosyl hydrolase family 12